MKLSQSISQLAARFGISPVNDLDYDDILTVVNEWTSDPAAESAIPVPDRVLARAVSEGLIAETAIPASGNWRDLAESLSSMAGPLYRMAAGIYGYRPVLICEMSSIVQADLLSVRLSPADWHNLFENGLVPVVEHGSTPAPDSRVLIATQDPSNRTIRQVVRFTSQHPPGYRICRAIGCHIHPTRHCTMRLGSGRDCKRTSSNTEETAAGRRYPTR